MNWLSGNRMVLGPCSALTSPVADRLPKKSLRRSHSSPLLSRWGVESLIEYPETMSHASMTEAARREAGITEKTIRVSVGIEHPDDLVADMRQALE
ncbi:MAG: PLP-dependent transferase [Planctomycetaceae bacterium]